MQAFRDVNMDDVMTDMGNTQNDTTIKVTPLQSALKNHKFDPGGSLGGFVAHICHNVIHIYIAEGLRFKSRNANHPESERIEHALRPLECRPIIHRDLLAHKMNQFGGGMQSLERRHHQNKALERCSFPVNQGICWGDVHDRYGN